MSHKKNLIAIASTGAAIAAVFLWAVVDKNTLYVSRSGSDAAQCSQDAPCLTIARALRLAQGGDAIVVAPGEYHEYVYVNKPVTLVTDGGAVVDGRGAAGVVRDGLVTLEDGAGLEGFVIRNAAGYGLSVLGDGNAVRHNVIYSTQGAGIWMRDGSGNLFESNEIYNTVQANRSGDGCDSTATAWASAINSWGDAGGNTWRGNYVHDNCGEGIVPYAGDTVEGNTFENNWSVEVYITRKNVAVRNNTIRNTREYIPREDAGWRAIPAGIAIGDEELPCRAVGSVIEGNNIIGARYGISFYSYVTCSGLVNSSIYNNTITATDYGLRILPGNHSGAFIYDNLILSPANITQPEIEIINNVMSSSIANNSKAWVVNTPSEIGAAMVAARRGDWIVVRGGTYGVPLTGWQFASGDVTLTNYPGEKVVLQQPAMNKSGNYIIKCLQTSPAVNGNRIIGTDGGLVLLGVDGAISPAIAAYQCDNWEVAGVTFDKVGYAIFQRKVNNGNTSADKWNVHDNHVADFYRESGMQFNGNGNRIENNRIVKQTAQYTSTYGCQLLNLLGNNNTVRGNTLTRINQSVRCIGIFFEWDLSDANLIENNVVRGVHNGLSFFGGDNNIIRGNDMSGVDTAFVIRSWADGTTAYPCNFSSFMPLESDTSNPDWTYYYPHDCRSKGNYFDGNIVTGFARLVYEYIPDGGNVFATGTPATRTPEPSQTPTATITAAITQTNTMTVTPTPTAIKTVTPAPTITHTPATGSICVLVTWERGLNLRPEPSMFNSPYRYMNFGMGAIFPVQDIFSNDEGLWMQINEHIYSAMYLTSNGKTYAVETPCP